MGAGAQGFRSHRLRAGSGQVSHEAAVISGKEDVAALQFQKRKRAMKRLSNMEGSMNPMPPWNFNEHAWGQRAVC